MKAKKYICCFLAMLMFVSVCMVGCKPSNQKYALTTEIENDICQSYWDTYVAESQSIRVSDLRAECVYQEEEIYAIFIHDPDLMYTMTRREESVGGVTLIFNDGQPLYIYNQNKIYDLKAAFEGQIIGTDYLKNLKTALDSFNRTVS